MSDSNETIPQEKMEKARGLFDMIGQVMQDFEIKGLKVDEENFRYSFHYRTKDLEHQMVISVNAQREMLLFSSFFQLKVDKERFPVFCEALARANYGMMIGYFSMDFRDGMPEFDVNIPFVDSIIGIELIPLVIRVIHSTVERYDDKFFAVAKGYLDPSEIS